ncbi:hypothetical protein [Aquibacillus rhizosphaerae]|uniref:Uncharacterized protein n=1 Tax=Aquibacillus rhizosphaerae TaxID=3051431 RepID=A0ABT7LAZ9_9BACI|nr:hypothetical protein [Aquibacillus sp. LR5S19]MDL4842375.1 hypothetical protein [Aquibacillus sp. LR5S19]
MKKIEWMIQLPSLILLLISLLLNYKTGSFISIAGVFLSLIIRQIRLHKYSYILGHPERHFYRRDRVSGSEAWDDVDQAETYERDFEEDKKITY